MSGIQTYIAAYIHTHTYIHTYMHVYGWEIPSISVDIVGSGNMETISNPGCIGLCFLSHQCTYVLISENMSKY